MRRFAGMSTLVERSPSLAIHLVFVSLKKEPFERLRAPSFTELNHNTAPALRNTYIETRTSTGVTWLGDKHALLVNKSVGKYNCNSDHTWDLAAACWSGIARLISPGGTSIKVDLNLVRFAGLTSRAGRHCLAGYHRGGVEDNVGSVRFQAFAG